MPYTEPRDSTIAIVGDGFGSLMVYATAVYLGFPPSQISIFGVQKSPVATYQQYAHNLGQTVLRSESESHFLPADWPTFAQLDAWSRRSLTPLARSVRRRYNPGVPDILAQAGAVANGLGWDHNRFPRKVGWLQRGGEQQDHFVLFDEDAEYVGRAKHVMLALGHGPLRFPPVLGEARNDPALADRIVQGYEPKRYARDGVYVVIGAGIASVNEWANALDAGGKVISLLRSPKPDEQDLNTPRCLFEAYGIDAYQALPFDERLAFLGKVLKGTSPARRSWHDRIQRGRSEGRFEELMGEIDQVEPGPAGLRIHISNAHGSSPGWLDVTGVVSSTGFNVSALSVPLYRRLIQHYAIPLEGGRMLLKQNCGVPGLDRPESRLAVMGILSNAVIPNGDTIAGLKYTARRFVGDCVRAEEPQRRGFGSRLGMQLRLSRDASRAIRKARRVEQLS